MAIICIIIYILLAIVNRVSLCLVVGLAACVIMTVSVVVVVVVAGYEGRAGTGSR